MRKILLLLGFICWITDIFGQRIINNPDFEMRNTMVPRITRIELHKDKTIVFIQCTFTPGAWVAINKFEILEDTDSGERYLPLMLQDGRLGEQVTVPRSGMVNFEVIYPPLKSTVRKVNFRDINKTGWAIYGISLNDVKPVSIWNSPVYTARNNSMLHIQQMEFFPHKTHIYMEYIGSSFGTVRLDTDLFLEDAESMEKFYMTDMFGGRLNETISLPANGKANFILVYPAANPSKTYNLRVDNQVKWAIYGLQKERRTDIEKIENPAFEVSNQMGLHIDKIELSDLYTRLYIRYQGASGTTVKFGSGTFLEDAGNKTQYLPVCMEGDGDELNKYITIPSSGEVNVIIHYPPLPKETKKINYRHNIPGFFSIYGIKIR